RGALLRTHSHRANEKWRRESVKTPIAKRSSKKRRRTELGSNPKRTHLGSPARLFPSDKRRVRVRIASSWPSHPLGSAHPARIRRSPDRTISRSLRSHYH